MAKKEDKRYDPRILIMTLVGLAYGGIVGWVYGKDAGRKAVWESQEKTALKNRLWELESTLASLRMQAKERETANGSPS